jgi:hypothetical protein
VAVTKRADSVASLAKDLVAGDKLLQKQLQTLVQESINMAFYTMRHGAPAEKLALMKHLTPHMLEALRTTNQSADDEEKRQAYEEIRRMCRGEDV